MSSAPRSETPRGASSLARLASGRSTFAGVGLHARLTGEAPAKVVPSSPSQLLARQALTVLEARMVNVSRFDALAERLTSNVFVWSSESTYERAIAAAQRAVPGFDPTR